MITVPHSHAGREDKTLKARQKEAPDDVGWPLPPLPDIAPRSPVHAARAGLRVIVDDYFASIERSLRHNAQISHVQEPVVTAPHHKHIGPSDRLAPADPPSLSQVLAEIEGWLGP